MTGTIGTPEGNKELAEIWVGTDSGKKEVLRAWVGTASGNRIWYEKPGFTSADLTATVLDFRRVKLDWTAIGLVDSYRLYRGATLIYQGVAGTWTDAGVAAGTTHTYRLDAILSGAVAASDTVTATTGPAPTITITPTNGGWDRINIAWQNIGADSYKIYRGAGTTPIYNSTWKASITDAGLWFNTGYTYRVEALWGTTVYATKTSSTVTTSNRTGMGFTASGVQGQINFSWNDTNGGAVDAYEVWLYNPSSGIIGRYGGPGGGSGSHTGLPDNWTGYYELTAFRGAEVIHKEQVGARTYRLVTGTAYSNVGWESFTGWTASTQRLLTGPNIAVPVGGTFTNMLALVYGRGGAAFRGEPRINGVAGPQQVYTVGRSHTNWPFNLGYGAGTFTTAVVVGGTNWGTAEWSPWSGQVWNYYLQVHQLDYRYYTSQRAFEDLRRFEWWDRELEAEDAPPIHLETWTDPDNPDDIIRARITDTDSEETLVEWEAGNG